MINYNKKEIFRETVNLLQKSLDGVKNSAKSTNERAIAAPGSMVSYSDTSKSQLQTLAYSLNERIYSLEIELNSLKNHKIEDNKDIVSLGALVELEELDTGQSKLLYVLPTGGGTMIKTTKGLVNIITLKSPLFLAMDGSKVNKEFTFEHNNKKQEYYISSIQ